METQTNFPKEVFFASAQKCGYFFNIRKKIWIQCYDQEQEKYEE